MFASIHEGIELYKAMLKNYLSECSEFDSKPEKTHREGIDHSTRRKDIETTLKGMELALGLRQEEITGMTSEIVSTQKNA